MNEGMHNTTSQKPSVKQRRPYHAPRLEDYGAVNELTRSSASGSYSADAPTFYTSNP
jgi:hypothetical protein